MEVADEVITNVLRERLALEDVLYISQGTGSETYVLSNSDKVFLEVRRRSQIIPIMCAASFALIS